MIFYFYENPLWVDRYLLKNHNTESHGFDEQNSLDENNEDLGGINVDLSLDDGGPVTISGSCLDTFKFVKCSDENIYGYFNSLATSCTSISSLYINSFCK